MTTPSPPPQKSPMDLDDETVRHREGSPAKKARITAPPESPVPELEEQRVFDEDGKLVSQYTVRTDTGVLHGKFVEFNGPLQTHTTYADGKKHGPCLINIRDGIPTNKGEYKDGKKDGLWQELNYKGKELCCTTYAKGKMHGDCKMLHSNGTPSEQGRYERGKKEGIWETRNKDGMLLFRGEYHKGKPMGRFERYHKDGGNLKWSCTYKNSKRDGVEQEFDKDGKLLNEQYFKNGKPDGEAKEFEYGGSKRLATHMMYADGKLIKNFLSKDQ